MIGSMYSGISGLKANTSAMEVIGDNIANVDTTGFKASTTSFANVFSSTLTTDTPQAGNGTSLQSISAQWDSGALESTNSATDFSINGTGLFVVNDPSTEVSYYTRAGEFEWDKDGNLITNDGFIVQGYSIATDGTVGSIDDISLPLETNEPAATENLTFGLNLNSDAEHLDTFPSSITTYNSLGSEVILDATFTRYIDSTTGTDGWYWYVETDPTTASCDAGGFITFDTDGNLDTTNSIYGDISLTDSDGDDQYDTFALANTNTGNPNIVVGDLEGAEDLDITWVYGTGDAATFASDGSVTGYSSDSIKTAQSQDGVPSGTLQTVSVDEDGVFSGVYSNGSIVPFAQFALADFPSYSGLSKMGGNLYAESLSSGEPLIGAANTASLGSIAPSTLEMSNVDLATEFVEMITTQRAYQANSKVITTSDELLNELVNLKR
jgi:flagellar hook protein FlgE